MIDDRVAEHLIEPADHRGPDLLDLGEALHEGALQDLLGERAIADATLDEAQELAVVGDQHRDGVGGRRGVVGERGIEERRRIGHGQPAGWRSGDVVPIVPSARRLRRSNRRRRSELASTDTDDSDIAALATIGDNNQPVAG